MQADWEFEVGVDAPLIDPHWEGFVDLRSAPRRAHNLPECGNCAGLAAALMKLNSSGSPVWTAKCDFWPELDTAEFDPDELDAPRGASAHGIACYIDILSRDDRAWSSPRAAEAVCRQVCGLLAAAPLSCCRVDLIIRRALLVPDRMDLGMTAYVTACGATESEAGRTLEKALAAFAEAVCPNSTIQ